MWNSLSDHVVDVNSLKQFETRLDKFWDNQDVMFDWTAEITGTGDRSESSLSSLLFSSGQTAVKLSSAEATDRAQCAAPDKPVGY